MKIALIGYGKMGQMIESIAPKHQIEVVAHFDEFNLLKDSEEHRNLLKDINILGLGVKNLKAPMVYPLLIEKKGLKDWLIENKIYVATYWTDVFDWVSNKDFEYTLAKYLIPLPIDQRYNKHDLIRIVEKIKSYL